MPENSRSAMTSVPRASSSLVAFWAVAGFATILVGDALVRGDLHVFVISFAPAGLVVWLAWMFLYRPSIHFDSRGLVAVNPGRIITIPWSRVATAQQRFQLVIELDDGSRITCWGSPFPEKPGLRRRSEDASRHERPGGEVAAALEAARSTAAAGSSDAPVMRRLDTIPLAIGAALLLACAIELLLAR